MSIPIPQKIGDLCHMRNAFLILCLLAWGCRPSSEPAQVETTFYHWKSHLALGQVEQDALSTLNSQRLYLRFFDVDIDARTQKPGPVAKLKVEQAPPAGMEIVPCIFVTNRTLKQASQQQVASLAQQMADLIHKTRRQLPAHPIREIQIDCDWTPSTQVAYFDLLHQLKQHFSRDSLQLSATIRLHQYKLFSQTGVPPVDRGMLMAYNLGNVRSPKEDNSIFSLQDLRRYMLPAQEYPLPLDLALPIFSWAVLLREGKAIRLLNNLRIKDLHANPQMQPHGKTEAIVQESHYFEGHYLYKGDLLRAEAVDFETLDQACQLLSEVLPEAPENLVFYHLDEHTLDDYSTQQLQILAGHFHWPSP